MKLPPGQTLTRRFPVVGEKSPPPEALALDRWKLEIRGLLTSEVEIDYPAMRALATQERTVDIHCVTSWSQLGMRFTGIPFRALLAHFRSSPLATARFVRFEAYSDRLHDTSLPLQVALDDAWLVHSFDGEELTPSRGFPLRVVTPSRYFYKSLKWVRRITLLDTDRLGFWERTSGYHNNGDPWREERLEGHRFTSRQDGDAFRKLSCFQAWRNQAPGEAPGVIVKGDFRGWHPRTRDLSGLQLKACDFREACLDGVDFTGANLTLARFAGASLRDACFDDADLEGADFSGAHLAGARFRRNLLSAATFFRDGKGLLSHEGMTLAEPDGLLEDQEAYLAGIGITFADAS